MNNNRAIEKLGEVLGRIRREKVLSQMSLGQASETSQMTVQRLESGHGGGTKIESLMGIATVLEIPLSDVFYEIEQGENESKEMKSQWDLLIERLNKLTPSSKEWIGSIIEKALDHP